MNVAFEISPLITASGTFGDRSGVYRYMYGLINTYIGLTQQKNEDAKIILFSFNRDIVRKPLNSDILDLLNNKNVIFLNKFQNVSIHSTTSIEDSYILNLPVIYHIVKTINAIVDMKKFYRNYIARINFESYLKSLIKKLKSYRVKAVFHSETGFIYLPGFKNIITIYDLTTILHPEFHRDETIDLQNRKFKFAKLAADGIICISQKTKKDLIKSSPKLAAKKITIIYPSIDPIFEDFKLTHKLKYNVSDINQILKKSHGFICAKKYLLYYGTFEPRKNIFFAVKAFINLHEENKVPKDFKFVLCGGKGWGDIQTLVKNYLKELFPLQYKSPVILLEYINDEYLKSLIKFAYAVVYPSLYEGFGLPVLESMSIGTPVICSNTSSLPEVAGKAALYINPENHYSLKNQLEKLINNPKLAEDCTKKGIKQSNKFNWEKSSVKLYKFLQEL